jgi:nucleoside-diphosphate kinase
MTTTHTFAFIKPRAARLYMKEIMQEIFENGIIVRRLETRPMTFDEATALYKQHLGKEWFEDLIEYTMSGPVVLMELEKVSSSSIVSFWRMMIGDTNSANAAGPTLRGRFGNKEVIRENAVHGSDSPEAATRELAIFWPAHKR